jgi:hypothetical protein
MQNGRVSWRTISDPLYEDIPLALKHRAVDQAQVRYRVACMEQGKRNHEPGVILREFLLLVTQNLVYIIKYPFRKLS